MLYGIHEFLSIIQANKVVDTLFVWGELFM
jgi:hypothetical protein